MPKRSNSICKYKTVILATVSNYKLFLTLLLLQYFLPCGGNLVITCHFANNLIISLVEEKLRKKLLKCDYMLKEKTVHDFAHARGSR